MTTKSAHRLTRDSWLTVGYAALAELGPPALKAEPLARQLKTTKGSFYWHFKDVPDYHAALLAAWEDQAQADISAGLADETNAVGRLRRLGQLIADKNASAYPALSVEPAIRAWATSSDQAAQSVARVDQLRLTELRVLLAEVGIGNPEMAHILYAASIGMEQLEQDDTALNASAMGSLVDLVLALR